MTLFKCGNGHNRVLWNYCWTQKEKCYSFKHTLLWPSHQVIVVNLPEWPATSPSPWEKKKKTIQSAIDQLQRASEGPTGSGTSPLYCLVLSKTIDNCCHDKFFFAGVSVATEQATWHRSPCRVAKSLLNTATRREKKKSRKKTQAAFISNKSPLHVSYSQWSSAMSRLWRRCAIGPWIRLKKRIITCCNKGDCAWSQRGVCSCLPLLVLTPSLISSSAVREHRNKSESGKARPGRTHT